jgi:hypothetical protein
MPLPVESAPGSNSMSRRRYASVAATIPPPWIWRRTGRTPRWCSRCNSHPRSTTSAWPRSRTCCTGRLLVDDANGGITTTQVDSLLDITINVIDGSMCKKCFVKIILFPLPFIEEADLCNFSIWPLALFYSDMKDMGNLTISIKEISHNHQATPIPPNQTTIGYP